MEEVVGLLEVAFELEDEADLAGDGDDVAHVVDAFILREQKRQVVMGGQVLIMRAVGRLVLAVGFQSGSFCSVCR